MAEMSMLLKRLSTNPVYRVIAGRVVLPWAMASMRPTGYGLEIGAGSGAMAARLLTRSPELRMVVTDEDPELVAGAIQTLARFRERAMVSRSAAGLIARFSATKTS